MSHLASTNNIKTILSKQSHVFRAGFRACPHVNGGDGACHEEQGSGGCPQRVQRAPRKFV
eukprot:scaffold721_cov131-Cylindrotheca_fusiformis.AAC.31